MTDAAAMPGLPVTIDWPAAATRFLALRLRPGDDLRGAIEAAFAAEPEAAGFVVAAVGSLSRATLRPAGREDPLVLGLPLEIIALSGTLSGDGVHLHMAVSDATGAMTGGHLLPGCTIRTTAELVLGLTGAVTFRRVPDPATGFPELDFSPTA